MRFEAKKKTLTTAISDVRSITDSLELAEGSTTAFRLKAEGKVLKVSSLYAEATVSEVVVEEPGEAIVDIGSLLQALSVSGTEFKFTSTGKTANYFCGRVSGAVAIQDVALDESILADAPKPTIHVASLKALLSALALKAAGKPTDRTLHFDSKNKSVRGEATDSFRGIVVTASVDKESKMPPTAALSLPQKSADVLAKLSTDALVGYNETFFTVKLAGFICVIPLSSVQPLEMLSQMTDLLGSQATYGDVTFKLSELKDALSDAISAVGKANSPNLSLSLNKGSTEVLFKGEAASGEAKIAFKADSNNITTKSVALGISALYLQECLNFYDTEVVKITVYQGAIVLDLVDASEIILRQTTLVPLLSLVEDKSDEEEAPKAKKTTPAPKKAEKPAPPPTAEDIDDES